MADPAFRTALVYDFDGTLAPGSMQEWKDAEKLAGFVADSVPTRLSQDAASVISMPAGRPDA